MSNEENKKVNAYLSFRLGEEFFVIHVNRVHQIMEVPEITEVPKSPDYMKGIMNHRGSVLPVIDTRIKFGMPLSEKTKNTSILIVDVKIGEAMIKTGLLVDAVQAVEQLDEKDLLPPPSLGDRYKSEFIAGMARIRDQFYIVLDIDAVFTVEEQIDIREIQKARDQISQGEA